MCYITHLNGAIPYVFPCILQFIEVFKIVKLIRKYLFLLINLLFLFIFIYQIRTTHTTHTPNRPTLTYITSLNIGLLAQCIRSKYICGSNHRILLYCRATNHQDQMNLFVLLGVTSSSIRYLLLILIYPSSNQVDGGRKIIATKLYSNMVVPYIDQKFRPSGKHFW